MFTGELLLYPADSADPNEIGKCLYSLFGFANTYKAQKIYYVCALCARMSDCAMHTPYFRWMENDERT